MLSVNLNHNFSYAFYCFFSEKIESINDLLAQGKIEKKYESLSGNTITVKINSSDIFLINGYRENIFPYEIFANDQGSMWACVDYPSFEIDNNKSCFNVYKETDTICIDIFVAYHINDYLKKRLLWDKERNFSFDIINQSQEKVKIPFRMRFRQFSSFYINLTHFLKEFSFSFEGQQELLEQKTHFEKRSGFYSFKEKQDLFLLKNNVLVPCKVTRFGNNFSEEFEPDRNDLFSEEKSHYRLGKIEFDGQGFFWEGKDTIFSFYEQKFLDEEGKEFYCEYELEKISKVEFFLNFEKYREEVKNLCEEKAKKIIEDRKKHYLEKEAFLNLFKENLNETLSLDDSYRTGNCKIGTENFLKKYKIDLKDNKITLKELYENENFEKFCQNSDFQRTIRMKFTYSTIKE